MFLRRAVAASCVLSVAFARIAIPAPIDVHDRAAVLRSYRDTYLESEARAHDWNGDRARCRPGTVRQSYLEAGLDRINWFRAMAGLEPVKKLVPELNVKCQRAALMMSANRALSHEPPRSWSCYSETGAEAASKSNLAAGYRTLADAIVGWMRDENTPIGGHRRWLLYPPMHETGLGAAFAGEYPGYAMWVVERAPGRRGPDWVAWPPAGYVPSPVVWEMWSFSVADADFKKARVSVRRNGRELRLQKHAVRTGFADNTILWTLTDWRDAPPVRDERYTVTVSNVLVDGAPQRFQYTVTVFDPERAGELRAKSWDPPQGRRRASGDTGEGD